MMNMMTTTGSSSSFLFLWALHTFAVVVFFVGVLFLIFWAWKTLTQEQFKTWGIGLAVIGTIACLLTIGTGAPWGNPGSTHQANGGMKCMGMMNQMTGGMEQEHHENGDAGPGMMDMSMGDMSMMLDGKTGDDFDRAFIQMMIPHHEGAISMAEAALQNARHDELKTMARDIIDSQQREIDQMRQWQEAWGYNDQE